MTKYITVAALLAAGSAFADAAVVSNINGTLNDPTEQLPAGGSGAYYGFSFTLPGSIEGITTSTVVLESIEFVRAYSQMKGIAATAWLNIYSSGTPTGNGYLGQSNDATATASVGSAADDAEWSSAVSFNGSSIELTLGTTYYVFFSSAEDTGEDYNAAEHIVKAALRLGKTDSGLVTLTGSDVAYVGTVGGTQGGGWMPAYKVTVSSPAVPEPSAFGLLAGLGALALVASRRRRK